MRLLLLIMKIGIYGGSFNPIHYGHLGLVKWIINHTDLDQIWLMVSPNNPLKDKSILADENDRLKNVKLALSLENDERLVASDFQFNLPKPNYTSDTLRLLSEQYPEHEFTLIIGEDNLSIFNKWKDYEYLLSNFRIFVYPRPNTGEYDLPAGKDITIFKGAPQFDISSTQMYTHMINQKLKTVYEKCHPKA